VARALDQLLEAGVRISVDVENVRTECTRIAGVLLEREQRLVGLLPADASVAVPAVALQLARGLVEVSGSPCGIVDAGGTWPVTRPTAPDVPESRFGATWLLEDLALLTPYALEPGVALPRLDAALREEASVFGTLVVDLTGFERRGEHAAAIDLLDGTIVIARAGRTTEEPLRRWQREIPPERYLGVLLTGAR
jgi:hypothetical protein